MNESVFQYNVIITSLIHMTNLLSLPVNMNFFFKTVNFLNTLHSQYCGWRLESHRIDCKKADLLILLNRNCQNEINSMKRVTTYVLSQGFSSCPQFQSSEMLSSVTLSHDWEGLDPHRMEAVGAIWLVLLAHDREVTS